MKLGERVDWVDWVVRGLTMEENNELTIMAENMGVIEREKREVRR